MKKAFIGWMAALLIAGCGAPTNTTPAETEAPAETPAQESAPAEAPPMRNFAALTIGPYQVQPMYEEEIPNGHYNLRITGGDFNAARIWVGEEDPGDNMVVKTEVEFDYQHGHLEVPQPLPDGYALWIEIEAPDGTLHKGSTPLEPAE